MPQGCGLGADGVRLRVACVNQDDEYLRGVAESVAGDLRAVGVELELQFAEPFAAFYGAVAADAPSFISKWLWQDPTDAIIGFSASWGAPEPNWQRSSLPELDDAFRAWLRAGTDDELRAASSQAQHAAATGLPYIPLVTPEDVFVHAADGRGLGAVRREPVSVLRPYEERPEWTRIGTRESES